MITEEWIVYIVLAVEVVNLCLLLGLLYVYYGSYKKIKSKFTIGLLFFSSTFLLKSIVFIIGLLIFIIIFSTPYDHMDRGPPIGGLFLVNIIECVSLSILFKITWE